MKKYLHGFLVLVVTLTILLALGNVFYLARGFSTEKCILKIEPTSQIVTRGDIITVDILIVNVTELYGSDIKLYFDNSVLQATEVVYGDFLTSDGASSMKLKCEFNNTIGIVRIAECRMGVPLGVNGTGVLGSIVFSGKNIGTSQLDIDAILTNSTPGYYIPDKIINGSVEIILGSSPKTINFIDDSFGGDEAKIINWLWQFYYSNGTLLDEKYTRNVTYTFPSYGKYYVDFTVTNECGNTDSTGLICIDTGCPIPEAKFKHTGFIC